MLNSGPYCAPNYDNGYIRQFTSPVKSAFVPILFVPASTKPPCESVDQCIACHQQDAEHCLNRGCDPRRVDHRHYVMIDEVATISRQPTFSP